MIRKALIPNPHRLPEEIAPAQEIGPVHEHIAKWLTRTGTGGGNKRTYVLARTREIYLIWVRSGGGGGARKLQDCNWLGGRVDMRGVSFTSPLVELVVVNGWDTGWTAEDRDAGFRLISRYCLEKRVHTAPLVTDL